MVEAAGAKSATIGYKGYQHASCISVNHVVCHGIPNDKRLKAGDFVNIDVTVIRDGFHGDTSRMYFVGKPAASRARLKNPGAHGARRPRNSSNWLARCAAKGRLKSVRL